MGLAAPVGLGRGRSPATRLAAAVGLGLGRSPATRPAAVGLVGAVGLMPCVAFAQPDASPFAPAPSDPALFETVINVPGDVAGIEGSTFIGSDTQLNVYDGGSIGGFFDAGHPDGSGRNTELNIFGGLIGLGLDTYAGATVNVFGGDLADSWTCFSRHPFFNVYDGGTVNIAGGQVGWWPGESSFCSVHNFPASIAVQVGGTLNISGGEIGGFCTVSPGGTVHITGGTVPSLYTDCGDQDDAFWARCPDGPRSCWADCGTIDISGGEVRWVDASHGTVTVSGDSFVRYLHSQYGRVLLAGGRADAPCIENGALDITGGVIGDGTAAWNSTVRISGGEIGSEMWIFDGSTATITAGVFGDCLEIDHGSTATIADGVFGDDLFIDNHSLVEISGGTFGEAFAVRNGSTVRLIAESLSIDSVPVELAPGRPHVVSQRGGELLEATLLDGSVFDLRLHASRSSDGPSTEDLVDPTSTLVVIRPHPADMDGDYDADVFDLLAFVAAFVAGDVGRADLDNTGTVGVFDLLAYIALFVGG